jgi:hypothetical protein
MVRARAVAAEFVVLVIGVALGIRAVSGGWVEQRSGTVLYASLIYAGAFVIWPRLKPVAAGAVAVGFCWAVEFFQLTGVPAALSERSLAARLVLGMQFDWADIAWYPVGVVPLVLLHLWVRRRRAHGGARADPGSRAALPRG